jgi:hypothetical protein
MSKYAIDCRFPRKRLIQRLQACEQLAKEQRVAFVEAGSALNIIGRECLVGRTSGGPVFFYLDPPFWAKSSASKKGCYAVEHLHAIARHVVGDDPARSSGAVMRLTHAYLRERLQTTSLSETYIGRRFYYCSPTGGQYALTIPPLAGPAYAKGEVTGEDLSGLNRFPQLRRICDLVDQIGTHLYEDALIPVALAHSYAAYPLTQAQHILRLFTEETLGSSASGAPPL